MKVQKQTITFFFLFTFSVFIIAPAVISVMDNTFDISYFFSLSEEENKSEVGKKLDLDLMCSDKSTEAISVYEKTAKFINHDFNYSSFISECISPPPEQNIFSQLI